METACPAPPRPAARPAPPARPGPPPPRPRGPKRVAVVVGSGALQCAAAIGLWRVLEREGVRVDLAVGCSGGAIYAALHALGVSADEAEALTDRLWTRGVLTRPDRRAALRALLPRALGFDGRFGLVDDGPLGRALGAAFDGRTFGEAETPLRVVATDFETGDRVVLGAPGASGPATSVFDAVRASVAVPFVWRPWPVDGRLLCDGCLSDPLPVGAAVEAGADVVLAMGFEAARPRRVSTAMRFAFQVTSVYTNSLLRAGLARDRLAHGAAVVPVLPRFDRPPGLIATGRLGAVVRRGEAAAEAALPALEAALA